MMRWLAGVMSLGVAASVHAQQEVAYQSHDIFKVQAAASQAVNVMHTPVTVELKNVPLGTALDQVSKQSGVAVFYSPVLVPVDRKVSLSSKDMALGVVLQRLLQGTGTEARLLSEGKVTIGRISATPGQQARIAQGTILGKVINAKTKQPIAGAKITLDKPNAEALSGNDGVFRLSVPVGGHTIHVRAVGFVRKSVTVTVENEQSSAIEVILDPSASVLDEVVVTGTIVATERKAIPNPITVITAEDIEKRGITRIEELMHGDIPGVIALDQGIAAYEGGGGINESLGGMVTAQVYARGSSGLTSNANGSTTPLKTFVDGVELLDASYLGTLDPRSIERIEVITGPQAATIYGAGAMGGVMQIFTKKGAGQNQHDLTANLRYGMLQNSFTPAITPSHNHTAGLTGSVGPVLSYSSTLSYDYVGQWQPDLFSRRLGASVGLSSRINAVTASASLSTTATANGTNGTSSNWWFTSPTHIQKVLNGDWVPFNRAEMITQRVSKTSNQTVALNLDYRANEWWQHSATIGRSQNHFRLVPQAPVFSIPADTMYRTSESNGQRTNWSYNTTLVRAPGQWFSSTITLGASGSMSQQTQFMACTPSTNSTQYEKCGTYPQEIQLQKAINGNSWGGFTNLRLGFLQRLYFTFGLRGERNPNYGSERKVDWTPTNGVAYTIDIRELTVKFLASYGRATKSPSPDARLDAYYCNASYTPTCLLDRKGNPLVGPEYSRGPQGGMEVYWGNRLSFTVNHYQQRITDLLQYFVVDSVPYVSSAGDPRMRAVKQWNNIATIRQYGWEGTGTLSLGFLTLQGTYSWNEGRVQRMVRVTDGTVSPRIHPGGSFTHVPPHIGSLRASFAHGGTSISLHGNFVGKSLITTVDSHGDDTWYYDLNFARLRMYNVAVNRSIGNALTTKRGYSKSNLVASQRLNPWASLTATITNLGNRFASDEELYRPTLGRQTSIGVSLRYPLGR